LVQLLHTMSEALERMQARLEQLVEAHKKTPAVWAQHFTERVQIRVLSERIRALEKLEANPPEPAV
jgi:hypothetical protein